MKSAVLGRPAPVGVVAGGPARGHVGPGDEPVGVVEGPELGQGHASGWRPCAVRRPVDGGVVAHHQMAVGGGVHVELDAASAPSSSARPHGEQRRRRRFPGAALVGVGEDAASEPGVRRGQRAAASATVASASHDRPHPRRRHHPDARRRSTTPSCSARPSKSASRSTSSWATCPGRRRTRCPARRSRPGCAPTCRSTGRPGARAPTGPGRSASPPSDLPEVVVEIALRIQRLAGHPISPPCWPPSPTRAPPSAPTPSSGPPPSSSRSTSRRRAPAWAVEATYEGSLRFEESHLEDPSTIEPVIDVLTRWVASTLVQLADLPLHFLPAEPVGTGGADED